MPVNLIINRSTSFFTDNDEIGHYDPGDVLYTRVTIENKGDINAVDVSIEDSFVNDLNGSVLVADTLNVSPIAFNDTFVAIGNTVLRVGNTDGSVGTINGGISTFVQGNLLSNDKGSATVGLGAITGDVRPGFKIDVTPLAGGTTDKGGKYNLFADGSFNYVNDGTDVLVNGKLPSDSFTYTIRDTGLDGDYYTADDLISTATVTITFAEQTPGGANHRVWYVDSAAASGGDGTSAKPFQNLSAAQLNGAGGSGDLDSTGEYIYVKGAHTANFVLESGQHLIGGGSALVVNSTTLATAGSQATLNHSGVGVTLSTNNTVSGLNIDGSATTSVGISDGGGTVGTLNITNVGINVGANVPTNKQGQILDIDQNGTVNITLNSATSTGTTVNNGGVVHLAGLNGSFTVNGALSVTGSHSNAGLATIFGTGSGGFDVTLAGDVTIQTGSNSALTFQNMAQGSSLTLSGSGVKNIDTTGAPAVVIQSTDTATVNVSGGALDINTGGSGNGLVVSTNSGLTMNVSSNLISSAGSGNAVHINNNVATNNITFSGASKDIDTTVGTGISITNNSNATSVTFSNGGLDVDTTGGAGIAATNNASGTLIITGSGNSISSGAGIGLNVANTTIGSGGLNFTRIDVNGASQGIVLNTTGSTAGLTVTGTGAAGSGGTIQNTDQGALLTSTSNVSLTNMNFTNANDTNGTVRNVDNATSVADAHAAIDMTSVTGATFTGLVINGNGGSGGQQLGISGNVVTNFTFANGSISGHGDDVGEGAMRFWNLTGTANITNSTFSFANGDASAGENHIDIRNGTGPLALNVTGNVFNTTRTSTSGSGGLMLTTGSNATMTANVVNNDFNGMKTSGVEVFARDTSTLTVNITNGGTTGNHNIFDRQGGTSRAIGLNAEDTANLRFTVTNNTMNGAGGPIINMFSIDNAQVMGRINHNNITGGGAATPGSAIFVHAEDSSNAIVELRNNVILSNGQDAAISALTHGDGPNTGTADDATLDITIANNNITLSNNAGGTVGIDVRSGSNDGDVTKTAANVTGNTVNLSASGSDVAFLTRIGQSGSNLYLQGPVVGVDNQSRATSNWNGNGNTPVNSVFSFDYDSSAPAYSNPPAGAPYGGVVRTPTNMEAEEAPPETVTDGGLVDSPTVDNGTDSGSGSGSDGETETPPPATTPETSGPALIDDGVLSEAELAFMVEAAIQRWADAGATAEQLAAMRAVSVSVSDLGGLTLGVSHAGTISVDDDAGGWRWFVDSTPGDDGEYSGTGTRLQATDPNGLAGTRMDLLTVLTHELGHQIGLSDTFDGGERDELMYGTIRAGERRLPGDDDAAAANGAAVDGAFVVAPLSVGDLPAGQSVTVEWRSTVAFPTNGGVAGRIVGQTTVYGDNFSAFQSDANLMTAAADAYTVAIDGLKLGNLIYTDVNKNGAYDSGTDAPVQAGVALTLFVDDGDGVFDAGDLAVAYEDVNNNGSYDPLLDNAAPAGSTGNSLSGNPYRFLTTTTDANGLYAFNNLAPGNYIVRVDASNFGDGSLLGNRRAHAGAVDPDHPQGADVDGDNNAQQFLAGQAGTYAATRAIALDYGTEPTPGPNGTANDTNNTLDIGFDLPNQPPTLGQLQGDTVDYVEGADPVRLDSGGDALLTDSDSPDGNFNGGTLTVEITGNMYYEDVLTFSSDANNVYADHLNSKIYYKTGATTFTEIGTYTGGTHGDPLVITFNSNATTARVQELIGSIAYVNHNHTTPRTDERTITWTLVDGDLRENGGDDDVSVTTKVNVIAVNDPPEGEDNTRTISEDSTYTFAYDRYDQDASDFRFFDHDSNQVVGVRITELPLAGKLTLNYSDVTLGQFVSFWQITFGELKYTPAANATGSASFKFAVVDDGSGTAPDDNEDDSPNTFTFNINPVNDGPQLDLNGAAGGFDNSAVFSEDGSEVVLAAGALLTDVDSADLTGATVTVTSGFQASTDYVMIGLSTFGDVGSIHYEYNDQTGILTLSGTASVSAYEAVLRQVSFLSISQAPGSSRTLTWSVTDGTTASAPVTTDITINSSNDAPLIGDGSEELATVAEDSVSSDPADHQTVLQIFGGQFADPDGTATLAGVAVVGNDTSGNTGQWQYWTGLAWQNVGGGNDDSAFALTASTTIRFLPATNHVGAASTLSVRLIESGGAAFANGDLLDAEPNGTTTRYSSGLVTLDQSFTAVNDKPLLPNQPAVNADEQTATAVIANLNVSDAELDARNNGAGDYAGATFMINRNGGSNDDLFAVGTGANFTASNFKLLSGGLEFGTFGSGVSGLNISFNSAQTIATTALINEVIRSVTYTNLDDSPPSAPLQILFGLDDGSTTTGGQGTVQANGNYGGGLVNVTVLPDNDAPASTAPTNATIGWTEDTSAVALMQGVVLSDLDLPANFTGGSLTINVGGTGGGINFKPGSLFSVDEGRLIYDDAGTPRDLGAISLIGTTNVAVTGLTAEATLARLNDLVDDFTFYVFGDNPTAGDRTVTMTFNDGNNTGSGADVALTTVETQTLTVTAVNDVPVLDLDNTDASFDSAAAYAENDAAVLLAPNAELSDPDDAAMEQATVTISAGRVAGDQLTLGGLLSGNTGTGGAIAFSYNSTTGVLTLTGTASKADYQAALRLVGFSSSSDDPGTARTIAWNLNDGTASGTSRSTAVTVTPSEDAPVAQNDADSTTEAATKTITILGNDSDADGPAPAVAEIDGQAVTAGQTITLSGSGAKVTLNNDGTITYDPDGKFNWLTAPGSGAVNTSALDTFSYKLTGASATGSVEVTVNGLVSSGDLLYGDGNPNTITGTPNRDYFRVDQAGNDTINALGGNDTIFFGAFFTAADTVNGGDGADAIILQGNYAAGITLGTGLTSNISGIESISLAPGSFTDWGDLADNDYSYSLTTLDSNVASGAFLKVNGFYLSADENLTFNGAAETNGRFVILAGQGVDNLTGGKGNDIFAFGHDGRFGSTDVVHGGEGYDSIYLRGDYSLDFTAGGFGTISSIESITLGWAADSQFTAGGDGEFDYDIVWDDAMLATNTTVTVNGSGLAANETMAFNGTDEGGGHFRLWGGAAADTITGGGGNDLIYGGGGGDTLKGNGGIDTFRYHDVSESVTGVGNFDTIQGFAHNVDKIDLSIIDAKSFSAGDQAFSFIGAAAFSASGNSSAGQLRAVQTNAGTNTWKVEGDIDGNGTVDLYFEVVVEAGQPLTASDFYL